MAFNYFGQLSHVYTYSKFRPSPPLSLFKAILDFLGEKVPANSFKTEIAVDVGCGSGQGTAALSPFFKSVIGLDPSDDIIKEANVNNNESNVAYRVSSAEKLTVESNSVSLITVGQAIHWFNKEKFYLECQRVLKPSGVLAVYGYNLPEPLDGNGVAINLVTKYYEEVLKDYVLEGSRQVYLKSYTDPEFNEVPFIEGGLMTRKDNFSFDTQMKVSDLTGYVSSWSGFQNYISKRGNEDGKKLLLEFEDELKSILKKDRNDIISVRYRYFLLIGRKL